MKNIFTLFCTSLFFIVNLSISAQNDQVKYEKTMHSSYPTEVNSLLEIHNQYGNITLENWNKNEVSIDITISIWTKDEEKAQEYLNAFDVNTTSDSLKISLSSIINQEILDKTFNKSKGKFQIDYVIHHPVYLKLNLDNVYGDISMQETTGKTYIYLSYGKLKATNFAFDDTKPLSKINIKYGKATIDKCSYCECDLSYSTLEIQKNTAVLINSNYSKVNINETYSLISTSLYDDYKIAQCNKLNITGSYSTISSDIIKNSLTLNINYGGCEIKQIDSDFSEINIESKYADINAPITDGSCYEINMKVNYGTAKCSPKANIDKHISSNSTNISGFIGCKGNASSKVIVNSTYGDIKLY